MRIRVIGAPMDLGADRRGVDIGPSAIRYAALNEQLRRLGYSVHDIGNIHIPQPESRPVGHPKLKYLEPIVQASEELADTVEQALQDGEFPLILGGDHSIALGSISGVASVHKNLGVIWVDAHADFNTEETTPSGNIHGMILAALSGLGNHKLTHIKGWAPKIKPENIVIVGARDLDNEEKALLRQHHVSVFTMSDIDHYGIFEVSKRAVEIAGRNGRPIHLSFDMDSIDPREAPGVGTPVRGGLSYREAHTAMEVLADSRQIVSMDIVEVNSILDHENSTARLAVELILSALGKKIL
ncbi:arginase [Thermosporothrix hazakensis]|jgi:arginase|uniref:Arginase n=1 Tax=Thermosporothrix hazakensis TaxID=644383 RepID=A0A326TZV5_THEHA|nr:arginase [Thermosporothrix hazakensis]PZW23305.1 arginase [Thermosporothrix hazakensis]GCE47768.1 arginase [Thermosporothrix hazakensis]